MRVAAHCGAGGGASSLELSVLPPVLHCMRLLAAASLVAASFRHLRSVPRLSSMREKEKRLGWELVLGSWIALHHWIRSVQKLCISQVRQLPEPSFDNEASILTDAPPGHLEGCAWPPQRTGPGDQFEGTADKRGRAAV